VNRTDFDPGQLSSGAFYQLITAVIVPRPIAWVSSRSAEGVDNLAPHSFFSVSSTSPPIIQFTSVGRKDSLRNIEATGEFVVNFTPAGLIAEVNATATDFPAQLSEFDAVGLAREPSLRVTPPRVAASPAAFECRLHTIVSFGSSSVVMGRVVHLAVADAVLRDGKPAIDLLAPTSRLGGNEWGQLGEITDVARIPYGEWPGHYNPAAD
jgi:flavin reductase (DIM6/NTAB) family NADH-FMN oxidoreductase RutF